MYRTLLVIGLLLWHGRFSAGDESTAANSPNGVTASATNPRASAKFIHQKELTQFQPPVIVHSAMVCCCGGYSLHLRDSQGTEYLCCISQDDYGDDSLYESDIPANTLFLNASVPMRASARLPFSQKEADLVEQIIASAVKQHFGKNWEELSQYKPFDYQDYEEGGDGDRWNADCALVVLRLLAKKESHPFMDARRESVPEWFAAYDKVRQEEVAERRRIIEAQERFASCYPESARRFLRVNPDQLVAEPSVSLFDLSSDDNGDAPKIEKKMDPLSQQASGLAKAVGNPQKLIVMTSRAFGTTSDWTSSRNPMEEVATAAVAEVDGNAILGAFDEIKEDRNALQGAAFLFFFRNLSRKIPAPERAAWAARLAEVILTDGAGEDKSTVLNYLARDSSQETLDLLRSAAAGSVGSEIVHNNTLGDECVLKLQPHAMLCLAMRGDASVKPQIEQQLEVTDVCDRMALEVSLALLGEPNYLKREHFQAVSHEIPIGALRAVSMCNGRYGLEFAIEEALTHDWAMVRDGAIHTVKQVTGKQTFHEGKSPQRDSDEYLIQKWWKSEGQEFMKQKLAGQDT